MFMIFHKTDIQYSRTPAASRGCFRRQSDQNLHPQPRTPSTCMSAGPDCGVRYHACFTTLGCGPS